VRTIGTRLKLRVRLGADVERMISDLSELHESPVGRGARTTHARGFELCAVTRVELVAVTVPFGDDRRAVQLSHDRSLVEHCRTGTETHGAAEVVTSICSAISAMTGAEVLMEISVECASLSPRQCARIHDHDLHAEAQT